MNPQVLIIGGGSAGIAAALASARNGASTLLLERQASLGGMGTTALVHTFCGLYKITDDPTPIFANPGIPTEIAQTMMTATGIDAPTRMGKVDVLMQHPTTFAKVADDLTTAEQNLTVNFHTEVTNITLRTHNTPHTVETICRGKPKTFTPTVIVDTSGDAILAALTNLPFSIEPSEKLQRPAYCFALHNVTAEATHPDNRLIISGHIIKAVRNQTLPPTALGTGIRASGRPGELFLTIDLEANHPIPWDPTDPTSLTAVEQTGRATAHALQSFLTANVPGFENAFIGTLPARAGIRESRRYIGEATLTQEDLQTGTTHPDSIALATWPIELRETNRGPKLIYPENNRPCHIPLGCLRPANQTHLWTAGRCISSDHVAQAALRVMGTCFATGQAAGTAAALEAKNIQPTPKKVQGLQTPISNL